MTCPKPLRWTGHSSAARIVCVAAVSLLILCCFLKSSHADPLSTPVLLTDFDRGVTYEWGNGAAVDRRTVAPEDVIQTQSTTVKWNGIPVDTTLTAGVHYLRFGFNRTIKVGTLVMDADPRVEISALKPTAGYPGRLNVDGDWTPAARLNSAAATVWVLPPGLSTRALRLTFRRAADDPARAGYINGLSLLTERFANIAPQALSFPSANPNASASINNENQDGWSAWDNGATGAAQVVSSSHPESIILLWDKVVPLRGLCALWAGFGKCAVQVFTGATNQNPRSAPSTSWSTVGTYGIANGYPSGLYPNYIDFNSVITTRAVRVNLTAPTTEQHPHLVGKTFGGKRVWLGELIALRPLGSSDLSVGAPDAGTLHPPIPISFHLGQAAYVTLVIEASSGERVRNLVSETYFPAGDNTVWWDGQDDTGRDYDAPQHGVYYVPGRFVDPGTYRVRGLYRSALQLTYQMSAYTGGHPAWLLPDNTGGWLADHSPPSSTLFLPGAEPRILVGSRVAESGDGLAILNTSGRKVGAIHWIGGTWTGATHLTRDAGPKARAGIQAYAGAAWSQDADSTKGEIRLNGLNGSTVIPVLTYKLDSIDDAVLGGIAVYNHIMVASLTALGQLMVLDVSTGNILGTIPVPDPRGVAFDGTGRLFALSGAKLLRFESTTSLLKSGVSSGAVLNVMDLQDPQQIAVDSGGSLYISDWGSSHQVKVFNKNGMRIGAIGVAGPPKAGPYDPNHMNHPYGVTVTDGGQVWVAEQDSQPKRVSVWKANGTLIQAFYGPSQYGGGGELDGSDPTRFNYAGMEFALNWQTGASPLKTVFYRPEPGELHPVGMFVDGPPQTPIYLQGRHYYTNCYNCNPTNGAQLAFIWELENSVARPVAAVGSLSGWSETMPPQIQARIRGSVGPTVVDANVLVAWSDLNGDHQIEPNEVTFTATAVGSVLVNPDLTVVTGITTVVRPLGYTSAGAPIYDVTKGSTLVQGARAPVTSGGGQALMGGAGWTVLTVPPAPYPIQSSMSGAYNGKPLWTYPSLWPGLHPSHIAPIPDRPGELIGTTRLLGGLIRPRQGDAGDIWAVNGNKGTVYLFTVDGLFVGTLFADTRISSWAMPNAIPGMDVSGASLLEEDFWPSITQTRSGDVYLTVGVSASSTLLKLTGIDTIRRLPSSTLVVTKDMLAAAENYYAQLEAQAQLRRGRNVLTLALRKTAPAVDGNLADWAGASWAFIESRTTQVGDWGSVQQPVQAAVAIAGDRLYAAFQTFDTALLTNSGASLQSMFQTGGGLDILIGTDSNADPNRTSPVAGDVRLVVAQRNGRTIAAVYRPVVSGTTKPFTYVSPWRTVSIDRIDDVSSAVQFAGVGGNYELSVPLSVLGLTASPGKSVLADIGLLRGDGVATLQRLYWNNKMAGPVSDTALAAMLFPGLWGVWLMQPGAY